jgi:hypothetical protein
MVIFAPNGERGHCVASPFGQYRGQSVSSPTITANSHGDHRQSGPFGRLGVLPAVYTSLHGKCSGGGGAATCFREPDDVGPARRRPPGAGNNCWALNGKVIVIRSRQCLPPEIVESLREGLTSWNFTFWDCALVFSVLTLSMVDRLLWGDCQAAAVRQLFAKLDGMAGRPSACFDSGVTHVGE